MSNLVVISFPEEQTAFEMRDALSKMQKEYLIEMEDVVVVTKDAEGKVRVIEPAMTDLLKPDDVVYVKESLF